MSTDSASPTLGWDIDGVGGDDLQFDFRAALAFANKIQATDNVIASTPLALALPNDFSIGSAPASGAFGSGSLLRYSSQGNFVDTTAYLGFRFDAGFDGPGSFKYGWAKAKTSVFGTFPGASNGARLILSEWAWDDSGALIRAGQTGADPAPIPAPATPLLTLLGLGAMGVQAYRRRREEGLKRLAEEQDAGTA